MIHLVFNVLKPVSTVPFQTSVFLEPRFGKRELSHEDLGGFVHR